MAGSFGYVAPEVLGKKGHGKPVDIWSTGCVLISLCVNSGVYRAFSVITYVLLCGYAPFRSEDPKELVRETMAAKIEFHDRYWKNVSQEGATTFCTILLTTHTSAQKYLAKDFIQSLLNPSPTKRPTAAGALADHVRILFPVRPLVKLTLHIVAYHPHPVHRDRFARFARKLQPTCPLEVRHQLNSGSPQAPRRCQRFQNQWIQRLYQTGDSE